MTSDHADSGSKPRWDPRIPSLHEGCHPPQVTDDCCLARFFEGNTVIWKDIKLNTAATFRSARFWYVRFPHMTMQQGTVVAWEQLAYVTWHMTAAFWPSWKSLSDALWCPSKYVIDILKLLAVGCGIYIENQTIGGDTPRLTRGTTIGWKNRRQTWSIWNLYIHHWSRCLAYGLRCELLKSGVVFVYVLYVYIWILLHGNQPQALLYSKQNQRQMRWFPAGERPYGTVIWTLAVSGSFEPRLEPLRMWSQYFMNFNSPLRSENKLARIKDPEPKKDESWLETQSVNLNQSWTIYLRADTSTMDSDWNVTPSAGQHAATVLFWHLH